MHAPTLFWLFWRGQFVLLTAIATYLSWSPSPGEVFESFSDKFLHILCWGVLTLSLRLALMSQGRRLPWAALGLFAYSVVVEIGQIWVPNRMFSGLDLVANGVGVLLGLVGARLGDGLWRRWARG